MANRILVLVPISLALIGSAAGAQEATPRQWRLVTASERTLPATRPATAATKATAAPAQKAYVDPQTGQLVSSPVIAPEPDVAEQPVLRSARAKDRPLQITPEGYLYIDTSDYQMTATAHVGPDGRLHRNCVADHDLVGPKADEPLDDGRK